MKCTWCSAAPARPASLVRTAEQFAAVGTTRLLLTKLDEVANLGHLLPLLRSQPVAVELCDRRPERSRRHRAGQPPPGRMVLRMVFGISAKRVEAVDRLAGRVNRGRASRYDKIRSEGNSMRDQADELRLLVRRGV